MNYWLFKTEPSTYSIDSLAAKKNKTDTWEGIRNYTVRNMVRDDIKKSDLGFLYHSSCKTPGIAGVVKVVKEQYPDPTAFDPDSKYHDPKSSLDTPRWLMFDVKLVKIFADLTPLSVLREQPELESMTLLKRGNRLSITKVSEREWNYILSMK